MKKVAVVTDSPATIPEPLLRELDIRVVPVVLSFAGRSYRDGIDITPDEFYRQQRANGHLATTSAPSVGDFVRIYAAAAAAGASGIVSIHLPAHLSATMEAATVASGLIDDVPIHILNSRSVTMAEGFVVLEAARAAAAGAGMEAVVARAEEIIPKVRFYAMLDTLVYLYRGGRIGGAAALMGAMLQIKPVVHLVDGRVEPLAKPRTRGRGVELMIREMAASVDGRPVHAAVMQGDARPEADALRDRLAREFDCIELYTTEFTPVMGAHAGPGLLGIAYYVD
jgi:DegV family protein with EDD domain